MNNTGKIKAAVSVVIFAFLMAVSLLAGCEGETPGDKPEPGAAPTVPRPAPAGKHNLEPWLQGNIDWKQKEGATLSVLAAAHAGFPALKPLLPVFEALTGIRVGYLMVDEPVMRTKRQTDFSSGAGVYDVVPIGVTYLGEAHANGWLENLSNYMDDPSLTDGSWFNFDDIGAAFRKLHIKEGKFVAMPFSMATNIFWYRKDLFVKYDIEIPDSYEEIVVMKEKLQTAMDRDGIKDIHAFATRAKIGAGHNTWNVIPCIRAYGGEMLDENWHAAFNSPEAVTALGVYRDMITGKGAPPESESMGLYKMRRLFAEGKLASLIVGSDFFNELNGPEQSPVWDKWDAGVTPRGPAARVASPWAWAWAINSASGQKSAAWLFVQWATSEATIEMMETRITPARLSAWEASAFQELNAPGLIRAARWSLENAGPSRLQMGIPEFPEAGRVASIAFSEIFFGAPVKETLDEAVNKVDAIMKKGPTRRQRAGKEL